MIKLLLIVTLTIAIGEEKIFILKKGDKYSISETAPSRGVDGFVEIRKDIYGVLVKPYVSLKTQRPPACEIEDPKNMSPQLYNTLVELAKKRLERRRLLDQKLRSILTEDVVRRLNALERKYGLNYDNPISRSIDAFELYNRISVLVAVMAN